MKKRTIVKIILIIFLTLFLAFWITAFIKVCPSYTNLTLDVPGVLYPDYEETTYDKIFDGICPGLVKLKLISFVNNAVAVEPFDTDLGNLKNNFPNLAGAYDKINVFQAWELINNKLPQLSIVNLGILDTGVDASNGRHPEFEGVNFGNSPAESLRDNAVRLRSDLKAGHGTPISGIIGANNLSGDQTLPLGSPQMNGVISGISGLPYIMELRGTIFDILKLGRDLETLPQKSIVNMSYGNSACPKILFIEFTKRSCIKEADFDGITDFYSETFTKNGDKTFVIAAGNSGINTEDFIPANIQLDNVIVVSSTDLGDDRAHFSNFGESVKISAPGVQVYAPSIRGKGNFPFSGPEINNYKTDFNGTSVSAPLVTGVAAILKALEPEYQKHNPGLIMTPAKIKEILIQSADVLTTDDPLELSRSLGPTTGAINCNPKNLPNARGCRLNAHRAVAWLLPPTPVILNTPVVVPAP